MTIRAIVELFKRYLMVAGVIILFTNALEPDLINDNQTKRPNFVFVAVDDLNIYTSDFGNILGNFLGKVYPDEDLRLDVVKRLTPNLSRLSESAITFNNAYCAAPLCGPSRTSLLTGVPPHISGYYAHKQNFRDTETLRDVLTLPQYLKENGYFTTGIGKVFHKSKQEKRGDATVDWPDVERSWDKWIQTYTGTSAAGELAKGRVKKQEQLSTYWDKNSGKFYTRFGVSNIPREYSHDYNNADHAVRLLTDGISTKRDINRSPQTVEVPEDRPYFIACGLFAPHLPWIVPQEYMDRFPVEEMSINEDLLDEIKADLDDLSTYGKNYTKNTQFDELLHFGEGIEGKGGDINAWKAYLQAYLATIAYSDENIGYLLNAVENSQRKDNTILILWSDHGYHIGDKSRTGKITLWEAANHCNLFIKDYRTSAKGLYIDSPVSLQDLYPTIVSMAGLSRPEHIYGYDLNKIINEKGAKGRGPVLNTHHKNNHAIRTEKYRYIRFRDGSKELYDLDKDPYELVNLVNDQSNFELVARMEKLLNEQLDMRPKDFNEGYN